MLALLLVASFFYMGNAHFRGDSSSVTLPGIDVSHYQGMINWNAVRSSGIKFVSIKASEGVTYTDPDFYANWIGAHAAGLTRTAYHFAHPSISAIDQANYFVAAVTSAGGYAHNTSTMQLMLDLESTDGLEPPAVWSWVQAFMGHLQNLTGRPGIIYTGYYFWKDRVGNPSNNLNSPLWIAAYTKKPLIPQAWQNWTFWQYDDNGTIPGISGRTDVDIFNGDSESLAKLCF